MRQLNSMPHGASNACVKTYKDSEIRPEMVFEDCSRKMDGDVTLTVFVR